MSPATPPLAEFESALGGAVVRTLTANAGLQWSGRTLYDGVDPIALVAAHQCDALDTLEDQRALLDGAALRLRLSDAAFHAANAPLDEVERFVYELLEQFRCESLVPEGYPGLRRNLRERLARWGSAFVSSGITETSLGILLFTVALISWSRLTGNEIDDGMADLIESTRAGVVPEIGGDLSAMKRHRRDQARFNAHALRICRWVGQSVKGAQAQGQASARPFKSRNGFALRLHFQQGPPVPQPAAVIGENKAWQQGKQGYRIFSTRYDQEAEAGVLVRSALLQETRDQMDREISERGLNVSRLARRLQQRLAVTQRDGWHFQLEEGYIDSSRLSQLVCDPLNREIFLAERVMPVVRCAVTILLDCSGSMKAHAQATSLLVDLLGHALAMAGAETEILGFTTKSWSGGRALRDWQLAGSPELPGRLNERLHIVFKSASTPWRRARLALSALRRQELYREGMDGEALEWAAQRLVLRSVDRRILLVVSDGCPMDSATHQANGAHYLDQHLKQVVSRIEKEGSIEVCGLGVGLDLGCFYRRRLGIRLQEGLDHAMLTAVGDLISASPPFQPSSKPTVIA